MYCPFCQATDTRVADSRVIDDGKLVKRRRECLKCNAKFTTYEMPQLNMPQVVKLNGKREDFSNAKLRAGIQLALRKRNVSADLVESLIGKIQNQVKQHNAREISTNEIGELVMQELKKIDLIAYIRFASVYLKFKSLDEFQAEISKLLQDDFITKTEIKNKEVDNLETNNL